MLQNRLGAKLVCTTVIFFSDCWIIRVVLNPGTDNVDSEDCRAILAENGMYYRPNHLIHAVFQDLDSGDVLLDVMNRYKVVILFHGATKPEEIMSFQHHFISGLGYCPPSLV